MMQPLDSTRQRRRSPDMQAQLQVVQDASEDEDGSSRLEFNFFKIQTVVDPANSMPQALSHAEKLLLDATCKL